MSARDAVESVLELCRKHDRVCPAPDKWSDLWTALSEVAASRELASPPKALILSGWWHSSNLDESLRLAAQIQWAGSQEVLAETEALLRNLREEEWHHWSE